MSNKRAREGGGDNPSLVHVNAALRRELSQLTADMSEKKAIPEPRGGAVRFRVIPAELSDLSAELLFKEVRSALPVALVSCVQVTGLLWHSPFSRTVSSVRV